MRGAVDADREPADDGDTRFAQRDAHLVRVRQTVRSCRARTDDRDARPVERGQAVAFCQQHLGPAGHIVVDRVPGTAGDERERLTPHEGLEHGVVARDALPKPRQRDACRNIFRARVLTQHAGRQATPNGGECAEWPAPAEREPAHARRRHVG